MAGRVGDDPDGIVLRRALETAGVDVAYLGTDTERPTGLAVVLVSRRDENMIAVVPGANSGLSLADVETLQPAIAASRILLVQLEIPTDVVAAALAHAHDAAVPVVLNLSPAATLPADVLSMVTVLLVNRGEAEHLLRTALVEEDLLGAARQLQALGPRAAVITVGAHGAFYADGDDAGHVPAPQVDVVDTTGAGDAFAGALAAALARGADLRAAVEQAVHAGAAAVQHHGAQRGSAPEGTP
jgi:ribokinase